MGPGGARCGKGEWGGVGQGPSLQTRTRVAQVASLSAACDPGGGQRHGSTGAYAHTLRGVRARARPHAGARLAIMILATRALTRSRVWRQCAGRRLRGPGGWAHGVEPGPGPAAGTHFHTLRIYTTRIARVRGLPGAGAHSCAGSAAQANLGLRCCGSTVTVCLLPFWPYAAHVCPDVRDRCRVEKERFRGTLRARV